MKNPISDHELPPETGKTPKLSIEQLDAVHREAPATQKGNHARIHIDFRHEHYETICTRAKDANYPLGAYLKVLAQTLKSLALGADFRPPIDPKKLSILLALNKELTGHGRCLNFIANHVSPSAPDRTSVVAMLDMIRVPLIRALHATKRALTDDEPLP